MVLRGYRSPTGRWSKSGFVVTEKYTGNRWFLLAVTDMKSSEFYIAEMVSITPNNLAKVIKSQNFADLVVAICSFIDSRSAFVASGATAAMMVLAIASDRERVMPDSSSLCVAGRYA